MGNTALRRERRPSICFDDHMVFVHLEHVTDEKLKLVALATAPCVKASGCLSTGILKAAIGRRQMRLMHNNCD